ncbi:hypothetical protein ACQEUU_25290 [Nonomuraea sp. CA-218870]|uniref:hypothetical protein n=1 Tax=Nonomuraea sp. CA-218870 TaxID=3239998 RepID=UPI003D8D3BD2
MTNFTKRAVAAGFIAFSALSMLGTAAHAVQPTGTGTVTVQAPYWQSQGPFGTWSHCDSEKRTYVRYYQVSSCYMYNGSWWFDWRDR